MRSLWFSLFLLLVISTIAAGDSFFMQKGIGKMEACAERMEEEGTPSPKTAAQAREIFEKYRFLFSVSISMEAIDNMENALLLLESAVQNENAAEASAALVSYRYALYRIRDAAIPSFETVF